MALVACGGCAGPIEALSARYDDGPTSAIYLLGHGRHTGIALRRADVPAGLWPEAGDFPQADYLEVGWGDRDYYMAPDPGPWVALKAVFWPTPSVLHVVGLRGPVAAYFGRSEVIELPLSQPGLERLVRYIHDAYARDAARAAPLGPGLYGDSRFYPAREKFHLFNTCNTWTARALRAAGYPVSEAIRAEGVLAQVRGLGRVIQAPPGR